MFRKILIANRGEIALRVVRAARELGVQSVVVYSQADESSRPVLLADEAVCIGPAPAASSYLNVRNILAAALVTGAEDLSPMRAMLSGRGPMNTRLCSSHLAANSAFSARNP